MHIIKNFKTPSSYVTTLQSRVQKDGKLRGLKSHDYHILMQHVLPLCLHNLMQEKTRMFLIRPNRVSNKLCLKVINPSTMQVLRVKVVEIMSMLEKVFPPTCFDVMTHLVVHLVEELDLCGPIHTRWMHPMERYMKALKWYVKNVAQLEGSMATSYAIEEALGFCIEYIQQSQSMKGCKQDKVNNLITLSKLEQVDLK